MNKEKNNMGIFDLLKKLVEKEKIKEIAIETISFSDIEKWIENKTKENKTKEKEVLLLVKEKIKDFISELKEKIKILEDFDVGSKKETEHFKNIVIGSREKYIETTEDFIEKLNDLEETNLEKFIGKINKIFSDFDKASFKNYEKSTILIGKEMRNIKDSLKKFYKNLLEIFEKNKEIVSYFKNILIIRENLDTINTITKSLEKTNEKKLISNKKIIEKEEENKILKQNLEKIKISTNHIENLAKKEKINFLREQLKKDILELKQFIDFKALTNFFHIFEEQMIIIKNHREDFKTNFEKDDGNSIIHLLNESKLNNNKIANQIEQIKNKKEQIITQKQNIEKDKTQDISLQLKNISIEIDNLKIEKIKEEKRNEKTKTNKQELINSLKQELKKIDLELL